MKIALQESGSGNGTNTYLDRGGGGERRNPSRSRRAGVASASGVVTDCRAVYFFGVLRYAVLIQRRARTRRNRRPGMYHMIHNPPSPGVVGLQIGPYYRLAVALAQYSMMRDPAANAFHATEWDKRTKIPVHCITKRGKSCTARRRTLRGRRA